MEGVQRVVVGYSGGVQPNPSYSDIKDASEAVLIEYDPAIISYQDILDKWSASFAFYRHKPISRQYRHVLLYDNDVQRRLGEQKLSALRQTADAFVDVEPLAVFYRAEEHHQDFFLKSRREVEEANRKRAEEEKQSKMFPFSWHNIDY